MKIRLFVEDEAFIIDQNEAGEVQIRSANSPLVQRDRSCVGYIGEKAVPVSLRVEDDS